MMVAVALVLLIVVIAIIARLEEKLYEAFSNPYWMGFEDRDDEDYKWSDNIKNYQEEEK